MGEFLRYEQSGAIVTLTMNQPETRNALTGNTAIEEIVAACERIAREASVRAVVLTGAGSAFSSGGNLKDMKRYQGDAIGSARIRQEYRDGIQRVTLALHGLEIPTIAAVNGAAVGAGCDLACMCDIRMASERAVFAESFVKVGLVPGAGGAWLLPRVIGASRAAEMVFTGDTLDARQALEYGLVSRVVAHEALLPEALALAERIAANPGPALRLTKRLLREGQHMRLDSLLELSATYQAIIQKSTQHAEAVNAFLEKRAPRFED